MPLQMGRMNEYNGGGGAPRLSHGCGLAFMKPLEPDPTLYTLALPEAGVGQLRSDLNP